MTGVEEGKEDTVLYLLYRIEHIAHWCLSCAYHTHYNKQHNNIQNHNINAIFSHNTKYFSNVLVIAPYLKCYSEAPCKKGPLWWMRKKKKNKYQILVLVTATKEGKKEGGRSIEK